jgi:hypothetical protein
LFNKLFSESDTNNNNNNNNKDAKQLVKEKSEDCVGEGDGECPELVAGSVVDCCDGKGDAEQETEEYKNSYAYYKKMRKQK